MNIKDIYSIENLTLAWRKIEKAFEYGDVWFDPLLMAAFKMNLADNISALSLEIAEGRYTPSAIKPVPFPKSADSEGHPRVRQSFIVEIKDQLVWVAICNVIGWKFDKQMPAWSYGNRLFLYMWKEDGVWKFGNYRHSYRHLYKKWNQSWPAMRKRITTSLQCMARIRQDDMRDEFQQICEQERSVVVTEGDEENKDNYIRLKYLAPGYFDDGEEIRELFWMGVDLEKFYQKVRLPIVIEKIKNTLELPYDDPILSLLQRLSAYTIDYSDYLNGNAEADGYLSAMQLGERPECIDFLPTGLLVAGFLANVYMLDIDRLIDKKLDYNKDIIHFRYVDDHVFISTKPDILYVWVKEYISLIKEHGLIVNNEKIEPNGVWNESDDDGTIIKNIRTKAYIEPRHPNPLMTQTLTKVSNLSNLNLNLLSEKEFDLVFNDLQSLLVTEIPEQEIKRNTRISFACTMLSRLLVNGDVDYEELHRLRRLWISRNNGNPTLLSLAFNDGVIYDENKLKTQYPNVDFSILSEINRLLSDGEKQRIGRNKQVLELLCHALKEVPDKVKVWVRTMYFCAKHYSNGCKDVYGLLWKMKDSNTLHILSVEYIYALLNVVCAELAIKATARLKVNLYSEPQNRNNDQDFLNSIVHIPVLESEHSFVADSRLILAKAVALAEFFGKLSAGSSNVQLLDQQVYHNILIDETYWVRWFEDIIGKKSPKEYDEQSSAFDELEDAYKSESPYLPYWRQLKQTPQEIKEEGWLTLKQWIEYINETNISGLDVRKSELLSVKIMISLCDYIKTHIGDINDNFKLGIENVMIRQDDVISDKWNHYLDRDFKVEVKHKDADLVFGDAIWHPLVISEDYSIHTSLVYPLGVIFLQLLTKKSNMPWVFNREELGYEWHSVLNELMRSGHISSVNYRIVSSCLSLRSRETRMLEQSLPKEDFIVDTYRDKPLIKSWANLREQLCISLDLLMKNLISVANEEHRQLTVIDLE